MNIVKKLTAVSIEYNLPLNSITEKYCQFYRECKPRDLEEPMTLTYDETIYIMTKRYFEINNTKKEEN